MSLLTTLETAQALHLSKRTLDRLRVEGGGPRYLKIRRSIRYRQSDLADWLDRRCVSSTSEVVS
jgi:predicted DNA-binding transcriptional regulator AlpA